MMTSTVFYLAGLTVFSADSAVQDSTAGVAMAFDLSPPTDSPDGQRAEADTAAVSLATLLEPARFTLRHEIAAPLDEPGNASNNRSSFRVEYQTDFLDNYFVSLDVKRTVFWNSDHRARAHGGDLHYENTVRDAYVQFSKGNTSVKAGRQILIWGESDAGAITDVISPRNFSELFYISLEESRISQFMLTLDQFCAIGDWSLFYAPDAQYNQYPELGSAYYVDPFAGVARTRRAAADRGEYGLRWKKTFGRSDVSLMAAHLVDNDFSLRRAAVHADGTLLLDKFSQRFDMAGGAFNFATGDFLFSGEMALKAPRAFNDETLAIIEKDVVDTSLRAEYSLGKSGSHSVSLEAVNSHVLDWQPSIQRTPADTNSLVLGWNNTFLNDNLSANLLTVFNQTFRSFQHSLFLTYKWSDRLSFTLDAFHLDVKDSASDLYLYRNQSNAVFRVLYQF